MGHKLPEILLEVKHILDTAKYLSELVTVKKKQNNQSYLLIIEIGVICQSIEQIFMSKCERGIPLKMNQY